MEGGVMRGCSSASLMTSNQNEQRISIGGDMFYLHINIDLSLT